MDGVILTPLKQIHHVNGDILHAMKNIDIGFCGFGEAYFSSVNKGDIKGWKKHTQMTLNLIVPVGEIEFVICDSNHNHIFNVKLSQSNYQRLTIKPDYWVAFRGVATNNILLNIANIIHDPSESQSIDISEINYAW